MMAALAFEIEHRIDQMLDRLGAGDLAVLGDMADQDQRRAGGFGIAHQIEAWRCAPGRWCRARHPARRSRSSGWNRWRRCRAACRLPASPGCPRHWWPRPASAARRTGPCARRACAPAPSPLRRRYRRAWPPRLAYAPSACRISVDLPMPGSPPTSSAEPGTRPPPVTRSNSAMPVTRRGGGSSSVFRSSSAKRRPLPRRRALAADRRGGALLGDRVPAAAGLASARPFGMRRAAGLADKGEIAIARSHQVSSITLHFHLDRAFGAAVDELVDIGLPLWSISLGRAVPDDLALVEHGDAVGDLARADHVVGDGKRRGADILHRRDDQIVDHVGHDGIEAGGRLVEEDDLRIGGDGARQADALLHAAGQFGRARDRPRPAPRPTLASFSMAMSLAPWRAPCRGPGSGRTRHSPRPAGCRTAPRPGTACRICASSDRARAPRSWVTSSPSTKIVPSSGVQDAQHAFDRHRLAGARAADDDQRGLPGRWSDRRRPAPPWRRSAS